MRIIVGSTALNLWNLSRRVPLDTDIWADYYIASEPGLDAVMMPIDILKLVETEKLCGEHYATPNSVYTIKLSHLIYDIKWDKNKLDMLHLKWKGCTIIPELYEALNEHWKIVHGNKDFLSLNMTKDAFFTDNVNYVYDHDYLHELVAYPNPPMYSYVLKDGHQVMIDKNKFDLLPFEDRVRMFREEIAVIACERWLIDPQKKGTVNWYRAHMFSVRKTVTTLTKGWASRFLVENLEHFIKPDYNYYRHIIETLKL